jgi:nucleotide-binding universal stress UspA family protein
MKVLIPVSDNVFGKAITDFVLHHQWIAPLEFKIVYAIEPVSFGSVEALYTLEKVFSENESFGRTIVEAIGEQVQKRFPDALVTRFVTTGHPSGVILSIAKEWSPDLIVMGSHGRKGFDRLLLGSVSQAVIARSPCSVVIVKVPHPEELDVELSEADLPDQVRDLTLAE